MHLIFGDLTHRRVWISAYFAGINRNFSVPKDLRLKFYKPSWNNQTVDIWDDPAIDICDGLKGTDFSHSSVLSGEKSQDYFLEKSQGGYGSGQETYGRLVAYRGAYDETIVSIRNRPFRPVVLLSTLLNCLVSDMPNLEVVHCYQCHRS